jgi:MOSC domain-containing protein YiiM
VGRVLAIGPELRLAVTEPDERCAMINLDPDTAAMNPAVLRTVANTRGNRAGVYASVLRPGTVKTGDAVEIVE